MKAIGFALSLVCVAALGLWPVAAADKELKNGTCRPAAVVLDKDIQHVFFRSGEGDIIELFNHPSQKGWQTNNLTAVAKATRAAGNPTAYALNNTLHVVYRGADKQIYELYRGADTQWNTQNLTALTKAPEAASDPSGFAFDSAREQHVFFRTMDGAIVELYHKATGERPTWQMTNLTDEVRAPKAAGTPMGYVLWKGKLTEGARSLHVIYRGADKQINELFRPIDGKWAHSNLSAMTKAPEAAGNPTAFAIPGVRGQHVFFRTADGSLIELFRKVEGDRVSWHMNNLTTDASAPKAAGDPMAYLMDTGKLGRGTRSLHAVYRTSDGQIEELWRTPETKWAASNLSAETKAPKAASDPTGFSQPSNRTQHVIFESEGGRMVELYHVTEGQRAGWHMNLLPALTGKK